MMLKDIIIIFAFLKDGIAVIGLFKVNVIIYLLAQQLPINYIGIIIFVVVDPSNFNESFTKHFYHQNYNSFFSLHYLRL
jgi:hypothetical protein